MLKKKSPYLILVILLLLPLVSISKDNRNVLDSFAVLETTNRERNSILNAPTNPFGSAINAICNNNGSITDGSDDFISFELNPTAPTPLYEINYAYTATATQNGSAVIITLSDGSPATGVLFGVLNSFYTDALAGAGDVIVTIAPEFGGYPPLQYTVTDSAASCSMSCSVLNGNSLVYNYTIDGSTDLNSEQIHIPKFESDPGRALTQINVTITSSYRGGVVLENTNAAVSNFSFSSGITEVLNYAGATSFTGPVSYVNTGVMGVTSLPTGVLVPAQGSWIGDVLIGGIFSTSQRMIADGWLRYDLSQSIDPLLDPRWVTNATGDNTHDDDMMVLPYTQQIITSLNYNTATDITNFTGAGEVPLLFSTLTGTTISGIIKSSQSTNVKLEVQIEYIYNCSGTPSLIVNKPAPTNADNDSSGTVTLGDVLTYTITATNNGPVPISNVIVSDSLITPTGGTTPCATLAPMSTCVLIGTYTVQQGDVDAGQIFNTATADSDETMPVTDTQTTPVIQVISLIVNKPAPANADNDSSATVTLNDVLTYTITATNNGTVTLNNVIVSDPLLSPTSNSCATVAPMSTCVLVGTYTVQQSDVNAGQIFNTATADSNETMPVTDTQTTPVVSVNPAITLIKSSALSGTGLEGETILYTFVVTNTGDVTIFDIALIDTNVDAGSITYDPLDDVDSDNDIDSLVIGASATVTAIHTITASDVSVGRVINTATATGLTPTAIVVSDVSDSTNPADETGANDDPTSTSVHRPPPAMIPTLNLWMLLFLMAIIGLSSKRLLRKA